MLVFISRFAAQLGNKHQNNPHVDTSTVRYASTYIIIYQIPSWPDEVLFFKDLIYVILVNKTTPKRS